ncbi:hypothetical protein QFC21_005553 [Naganishia friedmannii]|uniref:Uncharacterized protein n=1 Tax=Naganishia friedmannii TaxID=89922 RepID=A0ACC2VAN9_9TREE|nr:hypothetical protein QFC21_005553 [Naganishia friedmannii]
MTTSTTTAPPDSIRLQIIDKNTPQSTFNDLFHLLMAAFGDGGPIWDHMCPPPRLPLEKQAAIGGLQQALDAGKSNVLFVLAVGSFPDGEERTLGMAVWGKPGYRYTPLSEETMTQAERDAFEGYDLEFRNEWKGTSQRHRDELMGDEPYWYMSGLAIHPSYQKYKIGSTLLDHGLAFADAANLPVLLESSLAGKRLYESRKFVKEIEYPNCATWQGMADMRFPLYRRPAQGTNE